MGIIDSFGRRITYLRLSVTDRCNLRCRYCMPAELAGPLRRAGVQRLNISLDSLRPETFSFITRGGELQRVLDGIAAAERAGFPPVKINMVVMGGINDDELLDFAALTIDRPCTVRFIEYMPTLKDDGWSSRCVPGGEILERIGRRYPLLPLVSGEMAGLARNFKIQGAAGAIGIITPVSGHFCDQCNRIRVTAAGMARGCLFSGGGIDLKPLLAAGDDGLLREALRTLIVGKPGRHHLTDDDGDHETVAMSRIGG